MTSNVWARTTLTVYVPYVGSVHTFRTEVAIVVQNKYIWEQVSPTDIDFYSNVCFALSAIAAVSVNCYPNYSAPIDESASSVLT